MKTKTKGFTSILLLAAVGALIALGAFAYSKFKPQTQQADPQNIGGSIQTQLTDTFGTFRTNVNTSLSNLDSAVASVTSTQATYGTIVTENTPLANNKGGTGTTTVPTAQQFFGSLGGASRYVTLTASSGITFSTTTTQLFISTAGFDNTANIAFTGNNTFAGSSTFNGFTHLASSTTFDNLSNGVLIASGTTPVSTVAPSTAGNVLQSTGSAWASAAFTVVSSTAADTIGTSFHNTTASSSGMTVNTDGRERLLIMCDMAVIQASDPQNHTITVGIYVDGVSQTSYQSFTGNFQTTNLTSLPASISFMTAVQSNGSHTAKCYVTDSTTGTGNYTAQGIGQTIVIGN